MKKENLNDGLKLFCAAVKEKEGKVLSLRTIRAALERYLKQPPINWTSRGPLLETLHLKVQTSTSMPLVRRTHTREKLANSPETAYYKIAGRPQDPAQLLRTTWFYIILYFGKETVRTKKTVQDCLNHLKRILSSRLKKTRFVAVIRRLASQRLEIWWKQCHSPPQLFPTRSTTVFGWCRLQFYLTTMLKQDISRQ